MTTYSKSYRQRISSRAFTAVISPQFEPLPIELKSPATVMLLLSSPEEEVLVKACEAIYKFAERGTCFYCFQIFVTFHLSSQPADEKLYLPRPLCALPPFWFCVFTLFSIYK